MKLDTDILAELLDGKRRCLEQLAALGARQQELIVAEEMVRLLDLLAVKQRLLRELDALERQLDPFRNQAPEQRRWKRPEDRGRCAQNVEACRRLLEAIVAQDKQCEAELIRRRDATADRLHGMHRAHEASGAYGSSTGAPVAQIDLSS